MGRKKKLGIIENVEITDIAAEGNAIAKIDSKVLFVPQAIPGDIIDVQLTRKRTSYMEGYIVNIKKPSPLRIKPFCAHFGVCGGCSWQHLPYDEQLKWKQKQVVDNLTRIGKIDIGKVNPIYLPKKQNFTGTNLNILFLTTGGLKKKKWKAPNILKNLEQAFIFQVCSIRFWILIIAGISQILLIKSG
jgi:23S rRNA (uracil1939-C5)-methyltransferase